MSDFDPVVSTVGNAFDVTTNNYSALSIINAIKTGGKNVRRGVEQIRDTIGRELDQHGDFKKAKKVSSVLKYALPGVLWSGTFSRRANDALVQHSGLLCADLDGLNSSLPEVRSNLMKSPHLYLLFLSPSGDGLKAVFRVPADVREHAGSFRAVEKHAGELTGVQIDEACKDVARLCFLSYDPDVYYNPNARAIVPLLERRKPMRVSNSLVNLNERQRIATELLGTIDWQSETEGFCPCPGKDRHTTANAAKDCKVYLDGSPTVNCVHNSCHGVIETYNYRLRSLIGRAENNGRQRIHIGEGERESAAESVELPPAPALYVSPPLTLLPAESQEYVRAAAGSLNVDVAYVLLPKLSSLGSAIGNARSILLKRGFGQPPIIWTGIIGRSGGRKSPALEAGCFAVLEHERELMRQNNTAAEISLADWEGKKKAERGTKPEPPLSLTCLMDDMTLEALADAMQANPRGLLVKKDELSHWFAAFDQYHASKGADVGRWLSLHTGVFFGLDRRTDHRRYRIHQPRVCVTGGIQPGVLTRVLTEDFFERGLPARFLFAAPPFRKDRWNEDVIPERAKKAVRYLFGALYDLQPEHENGEACPKLLRPDEDAEAEFIRYYNDCGDAAAESDEREEAAWSKLGGYAARLALIGQLARDPLSETISGEVMQAACDLSRWFGAEAVRIYATFAETRAEREQRKLVDFIESRRAVTVRDVMQCHWPLKNKREKAEQALNDLVKKGLGKWEPVPTTAKGGKPARVFRLLKASTSTKPSHLRGETGGFVDVDVSSVLTNTVKGEALVL